MLLYLLIFFTRRKRFGQELLARLTWQHGPAPGPSGGCGELSAPCLDNRSRGRQLSSVTALDGHNHYSDVRERFPPTASGRDARSEESELPEATVYGHRAGSRGGGGTPRGPCG